LHGKQQVERGCALCARDIAFFHFQGNFRQLAGVKSCQPEERRCALRAKCFVFFNLCEYFRHIARGGKLVADSCSSDTPLYYPVSPLVAVRRCNADIIIGIAFHHAIFFMAFEQHFSCLSVMKLCEMLHLHITEVT
jgi:hypothetical protein